jgi:hypothetical protein
MNFPCIKFLSHFTSNIGFVVLVILNFLEPYHKHDLSFSKQYGNFSNYLIEYSSRNDLNIHLNLEDFYIRDYQLSNFDLLISIWVIGIFSFILRLFITV